MTAQSMPASSTAAERGRLQRNRDPSLTSGTNGSLYDTQSAAPLQQVGDVDGR